jgi:uncharacterized membrane protein
MTDETTESPLPSPELFAQYESVLPGSADRIIALLEQQAEHRMRVEVSLVESAMRTERLGQVLGLAVVLFAFVVSAWLIFSGHGVPGTILGVTDLAGLVAVFARRGSREPVS